MNKKYVVLVLGLILVLALAGCGGQEGTSPAGEEEKPTIALGIVQIVEHPALDAAREGFLEALAENGYKEGENLAVDYQNAQNDQSILQSIAQKFASDKPDLILAIATPAAQAMAAATSDIPILITAVTDPVEANLVESMEQPDTNVTGTTDMNPISEQFELLKDLVPGANKVGVIYNAGEVNSQVQVDIVKEVAADLGLEIIEATVAGSADVMQAAQSLVSRVDVIYVPTDNTVVEAAQAVIQVANNSNIPIIAGESSVVDQGGLATIGINYKKLGRQTGEMALRIIDGASPQDMPIESQTDFNIIVNAGNAELLGITIPEDILNKAEQVIE